MNRAGKLADCVPNGDALEPLSRREAMSGGLAASSAFWSTHAAAEPAAGGAVEAEFSEIVSYARLRAYRGPKAAFFVRGSGEGFDGAAGIFRVDFADTSAADNGGTVLVDAAGRRWKRDYSCSIDVRWFGAKGDGLSDDTAALQAALDAFKPILGSEPDRCAIIRFPRGTYLISAPLRLWSGIWLRGDGCGTILRQCGSPTHLLDPTHTGKGDQCRYMTVEAISFQTSGNTWAIRSSAKLLLNTRFRDLHFNCGFCVNLEASYAQSCELQGFVSIGPLEQLLRLRGNRNSVVNFNKEGGSGDSNDPYLLFRDCSNLIIQDILLEGLGSANKCLVKLSNCRGSIGMSWFETSTSNGYALDIDDASTLYVRYNARVLTRTVNRVRVSRSSVVYFEHCGLAGSDGDFDDLITIDSTSRVVIDELIVRRQSNLLKLHRLANNLIVKRITCNAADRSKGLVQDSQPLYVGGNLLMNPSFEAGLFGWSLSGSRAAKIDFEASEVSSGLMMHLSFKEPTSSVLFQEIPVSAAQVGVPVTLTALVKVIASKTGFVSAALQNAGVSDSGIARVRTGHGWQLLTQTATPLAAGALRVGLNLISMDEVLVDDMSVVFGTVSAPNTTSQRSLDLNGRTMTNGSSPPITGTWKNGDLVFNSEPAVGSHVGWICTEAGMPGVWKAFGAIGA